MFEVLLLSAIQGITEFLPISSSAHLILISKYLDFNNENLIFDVSVHLGSLLGVVFFFKKDVIVFIQNKLLLKILLGTLPTIILGFFLVHLNLIDQLRNANIIAVTTIVFGILLYISDKSETKKKINTDLSITNSIFIGLLQMLSLIPGVSRSGIVITGARFLKYDRIESAKISFLFSIPILSIVSFYNILKIYKLDYFEITVQNYWAVIFSFIFSLITLKFFLNFLKKISFFIFVFYRIVLGILILLYVYY